MGACGTVTGSSYILTSSAGNSILIDLGMFQGPPEVDKLNYEPFAYNCAQLVGGILTHAHLDHCGRLPIILPLGFREKIWMTRPTSELVELALMDSAKIAKQDDREVILYDKELAMEMLETFLTVGYHDPFILGDFIVTFFDAGHIIGSASLLIEDKSATSGIKKIVFSGDLGNSPEDLVNSTELISSADAVVMESTYGGRLHPVEDSLNILQQEINAIEGKNSTLLIPAFALERTQELLHMIKHLKMDGKIKVETAVFIDSPMAEKATRIYMKYPNIFNSHIANEFKNSNPFDFPNLIVIEDHQESEKIHEYAGAKVIIAGSGMMTGGRILGHAIRYLPDANNHLLIVGYQGEGTIGRKLSEGEKIVEVEDVLVQVNASVNKTEGMSSHADQKQLMDWLTNIKGVKKVFLTHGEDESRLALKEKIKTDLGITDIILPILHEEVEF